MNPLLLTYLAVSLPIFLFIALRYYRMFEFRAHDPDTVKLMAAFLGIVLGFCLSIFWPVIILIYVAAVGVIQLDRRI